MMRKEGDWCWAVVVWLELGPNRYTIEKCRLVYNSSGVWETDKVRYILEENMFDNEDDAKRRLLYLELTS